MCVLAAYLGDEDAAPILLEMLEREEGLGGGYYTGLATVHEGKLHWAKVVGDVARLRRETDAARLPGGIGIAHSRTPSGGDREWSHPFIGNAETMAYVANGAEGRFKGETDWVAAGNGLLERGCHFRSSTAGAVGHYPRLSDGGSVHFSEIMCLLIEENWRQGGDLLAAAGQAFQDWPAEIVGLTLSADDNAHFVAMRINQPLVIGRSDRAVCAATTSLAFPPGMEWQMAMPPNAAARVGRDGVQVAPFTRFVPAADMPAADVVQDTVVAALREGPQTVGGMCNLLRPLWPEGRLGQSAMLVYQTVAALIAAGKAELTTETVPGMNGEGTAPRTSVQWSGA
jgi:glucosamine 6-phosphate synthetase-like amidotransferase/phosphosugar isomerase protein